MAGKMTDRSCAEFAVELAGKASVPGGGAAAAYVGALSVALCSMVGHFTVGKKAYADVELDVQDMINRSEASMRRLLDLMDEDARAFEPLARAYGIPKDDPGRAEVLENATKAACAAPIEMMRGLADIVELLEEMKAKGSRMLASDVGCGAALAAGALQAASMNVFVNTRNLEDRGYAEELEAEADALLAYVPRAQALAGEVAAELRA